MKALSTPLDRRRLLQLGAGGVAAAAVAGCSVDTGSGTTASAPAAQDFAFPTEGVNLPTGEVSFRWLDSGDLKAKFLDPAIKAFGEQHSNVKVTYDGAGWDQVNQVVPLGIRNGSAPDVFALPQNVPAQTAVNEGWIRPLEDVVPGFAEWRKGFPDTALIQGVHIFNGKVYSWPLNSLRRLDKMLFANTALAEKAGVDPAGIKTWDDFREAAKKFQASGKPGYLVTGDHLGPVVCALASSAGWLSYTDGLNAKTGQYEFASEPVFKAIELLKAMIADGTVVPGYMTLKDKDARAQFPTGNAGMLFNGPWDIPSWKAQNASFTYSVTAVPSPDGGSYVVPYRETGGNMAYVYAKTPIPEVVGVIMKYLGSQAGQTKMVELSGGNLLSVIPDANAKASESLLDPNAKKAADLARSIMRSGPQLEIRTPDAAKVKIALKPVEPSLVTLMQGVFTGQVPDYKKALAELDGKLNAAMDAAFATAKAGGANVDRSMLAFSNWKPTEDYTAADYQALR